MHFLGDHLLEVIPSFVIIVRATVKDPAPFFRTPVLVEFGYSASLDPWR